MERFSAPGIVATWEPERRLVTVDYEPGGAPTEAEAHRLVAAIRAWTGPTEPYVILSDVRNAREITAGYRAVWADFLKGDRHRSRLAAYNLTPFLRVMLNMFARGVSYEMRAFATREEALAWLGLDKT